MHLSQRRDGLGRIRIAADLERDREGALEVVDRVLGLAEEIVETAQVIQQAPDVLAIAVLLVQLLRALSECPRAQPLPIALGDERRLERDVRNRKRVVEAVGELERALDVLTRGLEVALPACAA